MAVGCAAAGRGAGGASGSGGGRDRGGTAAAGPSVDEPPRLLATASTATRLKEAWATMFIPSRPVR